MAFQKKTWLARLGQGLNKFIFNGGSKVTLDSSPDLVTQEGTPLSAENMNDLEDRIDSEFTNVNGAITSLIKTVTLNLTTDADGYAYYDFSSPVRVLSVFLSNADINVNGWMCGFAVRAGSPYLSYYFVVHGIDSSLFGSHQISVDVTYQDIQS